MVDVSNGRRWFGSALVVVSFIVACDVGADCNAGTYHPGADPSSTDQTGKQLLVCNPSGINFEGADFTGAELGSSNLTGSNLAGADLAGVNLG